ncbi:MAG: hypothetical protein ACREGF_03545, partial [Candidatus Saccharimonadales bacterium]
LNAISSEVSGYHSTNSELYGLACTTPTECEAVGYAMLYTPGSGTYPHGLLATAIISEPAPNAPANLTAISPTQNPSLSWDAVDGVTSYNVYRDGTDIGSTTGTTYNDMTAIEGTHSYYVTAVSSGGESNPSNTINVLVDRTAPVVTVTPVAGSTLSGTETFNITVSDNNPLDPTKNTSDWVYIYNTDGNWSQDYGQKVNLSSGSGTFTVNTNSANLPNGTYDLDVGVVYDAAGNPSGRSDNYFKNYTIDN